MPTCCIPGRRASRRAGVLQRRGIRRAGRPRKASLQSASGNARRVPQTSFRQFADRSPPRKTRPFRRCRAGPNRKRHPGARPGPSPPGECEVICARDIPEVHGSRANRRRGATPARDDAGEKSRPRGRGGGSRVRRVVGLRVHQGGGYPRGCHVWDTERASGHEGMPPRHIPSVSDPGAQSDHPAPAWTPGQRSAGCDVRMTSSGRCEPILLSGQPGS